MGHIKRSITVIALSTATVILAVGFLSTLSVLFTVCGDFIIGKKSGDEDSSGQIPDFFLIYGRDAGDSIVNGSDSRWLAPRRTFSVNNEESLGHILVQLDEPMGLITLQIVDIKSGSAIPESIYIYVNSGQGPFTASEGDCGSYVWVRTSTNQRDFDKINSAVGNGFDSKWAFVATWINFEGSTFQFIFASGDSSSSVSICNYGVLSEKHTGNKFAEVELYSTHKHESVTDLPTNKQLIWIMNDINDNN